MASLVDHRSPRCPLHQLTIKENWIWLLLRIEMEKVERIKQRNKIKLDKKAELDLKRAEKREKWKEIRKFKINKKISDSK